LFGIVTIIIVSIVIVSIIIYIISVIVVAISIYIYRAIIVAIVVSTDAVTIGVIGIIITINIEATIVESYTTGFINIGSEQRTIATGSIFIFTGFWICDTIIFKCFD
jgi:hypothetical protein